MSISAVSGRQTLEPATDTDRLVAVMKKKRDIEKATADALLELVKQAAPTPREGRINTYA
jgi:hypothetical protein